MSSLKASFSIGAEIALTLAALETAFTPAYLNSVEQGAVLLADTLRAGGKLLIMGNGGSAADAQHIAAELIGRFKSERHGLAAIALTTDSSILTAWSNDYGFETVFSRQIDTLAKPGDVVWGISTSGTSKNILRAFESARALGVSTLGMLGRDGGALAALSDVAMIVPLAATDHIQTAHLVTYHSLCGYLDVMFSPNA